MGEVASERFQNYNYTVPSVDCKSLLCSDFYEQQETSTVDSQNNAKTLFDVMLKMNIVVALVLL